MRELDVLFVHPGAAHIIYQELSKDITAIETPTWSLLLAEACRSKGFGVGILDCDAERLSNEDAIKRIKDINPRLVCFVVYGQNPNSGTTSMTGAVALAKEVRSNYPEYKIAFLGSHTSALPLEVLSLNCVDFVLIGDGVYALQNLLRTDLKTDLKNVRGIGFKDMGLPCMNMSEKVVPNDRMDLDLPGYAWDLLPYKNKPFDLYRAHIWHADFKSEHRTPFASIYSSVGCKFKCDFCMINLINRENYSDGITAANSNSMRFWSPKFIINQIEKLKEYGVDTIRFSDEMFFLDKRYFEPIVDMLGNINSDDKLRMWTYARVDTVREKYLDSFRKAGIRWLGLGVESGSQEIRREVTKGTYEEVNIREIIKKIGNHGINTIANYLFGLPDDNLSTMQQTLDLAIELNTEMANMHATTALPGSPLYNTCKENGWDLPKTFAGYSFFSYETVPMPTKYCTAAEVLKFRDDAWSAYFKRPEYLTMIENKFGPEARQTIENISKIKLKRKLLGD